MEAIMYKVLTYVGVVLSLVIAIFAILDPAKTPSWFMPTASILFAIYISFVFFWILHHPRENKEADKKAWAERFRGEKTTPLTDRLPAENTDDIVALAVEQSKNAPSCKGDFTLEDLVKMETDRVSMWLNSWEAKCACRSVKLGYIGDFKNVVIRCERCEQILK